MGSLASPYHRLSSAALLFMFCHALTAHAQEPAPDEEAKAVQIDRGLIDLDAVREDTPLPANLEVIDGFPDANREAFAFRETIFFASKQQQATLAKYSLKGLSLFQLYNPEQPISATRTGFLRGEIVRVEGRILKIQSVPSPMVLAKDGVPRYFEIWLLPPGSIFDPVLLICTELPKDLEPTTAKDRWAVFDGYWFKRLRYDSRPENVQGRQSDMRLAPLLIGPSITLREPIPDTRSEVEKAMLTANLPLIRFNRVRDNEKLLGYDQNQEEYEAYNYSLAFVRQVAPEELAKVARRDLKPTQLVQPIRQDYLREPIHVEGYLKFVGQPSLPSDRMRTLAPDVKHIYELMLQVPGAGRDFVMIHCTELPAGLKPGKQADSPWVIADGYFFKLCKYETAEPIPGSTENTWRAPLLLAYAPQIMALPIEQSESGNGFSGLFLPGLILISLVGGGAVVLSWWFTRSDREIRRQITEQRTKTNPFGS